MKRTIVSLAAAITVATGSVASLVLLDGSAGVASPARAASSTIHYSFTDPA